MSQGPQVKPTHKAVKTYYADLAAYADQSVSHEGAVRSAFQNLPADMGRKFGWAPIPELTIDAAAHQVHRSTGDVRHETFAIPHCGAHYDHARTHLGME